MKPTFSLGSLQGFLAVSPCHRLATSILPSVAASVRTGFVVMCCSLTLSCGQQNERVDSAAPSKLALVVPKTGALKDEGKMLQLGALTAMHEARAQTLNGKTEMVVYDSPCDVERAARVARRVAGNSSVSVVVGYLCAEALRAALPIYEQANLALINPTISAEYERNKGSRYLFYLMYGDGEQAAFLAAYVKKGLGLSRVAVLSDGSAYGDMLKRSFLAEAERQNLELVVKLPVTSDAAEVTRAVQLMKDVSPEAIFLAAKMNVSSLFLLERHRQKLVGKVLGPDRLADLDVYETVGKAAEGLLVCQPILLEKDDHEALGFVQRFEMLHKHRPDWIAAAGYDATRLVLEVLQRSGPGRAAFLQAMQEISGSDTSFPALGGPIFFRKDGTSRRLFFVAEIHEGRLRAAKPPSVEFP